MMLYVRPQEGTFNLVGVNSRPTAFPHLYRGPILSSGWGLVVRYQARYG